MAKKLSVVELVNMFDDAALSGKAAAAQFKKDHIDPLKGNADKLEALRGEVIGAAGVRFFLKDRKINGKAAAVDSDLMGKARDAFNAAKGVKLSDAQKKLRHAVQMYANNIWAEFKRGGERKPAKKPASKDTASDASKTETTGAVSNPEGADKGAIVQGQGVTAVELATAVFNWLAVHRDPNDRGDLVRELGAVLAEVSKWKVNQAVELRQVI